MLAANEVDLALTYDYNFAPAATGAGAESVPLWSTEWSLGVPAWRGVRPPVKDDDALAVFARFRDSDWIGNSRNRADEYVVQHHRVDGRLPAPADASGGQPRPCSRT